MRAASKDAAEAKREVVVIREVREELVVAFSGPLPHPDILAKFDKVVPGAASRIITMAENQAQHRMSLEKTVITGDSHRAWAGLVAGFVLGMSGIVGGVVLGIYGQVGFGGFLSGASLVSLVGVFVYGTRARSEERMQKAQQHGQQQIARRKHPKSSGAKAEPHCKSISRRLLDPFASTAACP